jgi:hypothetical protein
MKNKKVVIAVGLLLAVGLVGFYMWRKRKHVYEDYGRADWAGDTSKTSLALRSSKKPGVKVGDTVEVIQDNPAAKYKSINGEANVVEVFGPEKSWDKVSYWVVLDKAHPGSGPQEPGTYKRV